MASNRKLNLSEKLHLCFSLLIDLLELVLCDALAHSRRAGNTTAHGHQQGVDVLSPTPLQKHSEILHEYSRTVNYLLVKQNVRAEISFLPLNELYVSFHTLFSKILGEKV
jgi:hypothetical protein